MDDQELAAIRAARLQQLRQNSSTGGGSPNLPSGGPDPEEDAAKRATEEQMRRDLLATVLDSAARERCEKTKAIDDELVEELIVDISGANSTRQSGSVAADRVDTLAYGADGSA